MSTLKEFIEQKLLKGKRIQKDQCIILVLFGILLLVIVIPTRKKTGSIIKDNNKSMIEEQELEEITEEKTSDLEQYTEYLEAKLEQMLTGIEQVGKVKVMITMESSTEKVVEKEQPISRSNSEEKDSAGGSRSVNEMSTQENTVYQTLEGNSEPYIVKTLQPKVEGVMVVAQGAGIGTVSKNITEAIQVLFGIEAHKIKVVKMKTS